MFISPSTPPWPSGEPFKKKKEARERRGKEREDSRPSLDPSSRLNCPSGDKGNFKVGWFLCFLPFLLPPTLARNDGGGGGEEEEGEEVLRSNRPWLSGLKREGGGGRREKNAVALSPTSITRFLPLLTSAAAAKWMVHHFSASSQAATFLPMYVAAGKKVPQSSSSSFSSSFSDVQGTGSGEERRAKVTQKHNTWRSLFFSSRRLLFQLCENGLGGHLKKRKRKREGEREA